MSSSEKIVVTSPAKGDGKSQISVQHGHLESATEAARFKTYWAAQLGKLKEMLEG